MVVVVIMFVVAVTVVVMGAVVADAMVVIVAVSSRTHRSDVDIGHAHTGGHNLRHSHGGAAFDTLTKTEGKMNNKIITISLTDTCTVVVVIILIASSFSLPCI